MKRTTFWILTLIVVGIGVIVWASGSKDSSSNTEAYLKPASELMDVHGLAVDIADPNQLWIASHSGLFVIKNDNDLFKAGPSNDDYMGFAQDTTKPNTFYTAGHNAAMTANKGFQRSDDGGRTWKLVGKGASGQMDDFHALAVSPADSKVVYGSAMGQLQISTDGGANWKYAKNAPQVIALAASPDNKNTVYAATQNGLKVSKDQGSSWTNTGLINGVVMAVVINPGNPQEILAATQSQGLMKTTDSGTTWQAVQGNQTQGIMYIAYDKNTPTTIYTIAQDLSLQKTTDGGATWKKVR